LLAERGITADHVTVYRWVQRFTLLLIDAARQCRHVPGDRWFVDETYLKVAGRWVYLYRAIDQFGQVIDMLASPKRDLAATRRFFTRVLEHGPSPIRQRSTRPSSRRSPRVPGTTPSPTPTIRSNPITAIKVPAPADARSQRAPLRASSQCRARFIQNIRRGHYELGSKETVNPRVLAAFDELALAI
jgi:transposase, IS6 family